MQYYSVGTSFVAVACQGSVVLCQGPVWCSTGSDITEFTVYVQVSLQLHAMNLFGAVACQGSVVLCQGLSWCSTGSKITVSVQVPLQLHVRGQSCCVRD